MPDFTPTAEQADCLHLFATGRDLVIEAGAGTGKTATLRLLAESTPRIGAYIAFNKAIVAEASSKMPATVSCSTAHALAFRAVGRTYAHRLNGPRIKATAAAKILGIDPLVITTPFERKRLSPGFLAGIVNKAVARFCQTADAEVAEDHFPYLDGIDLPLPDGRRGYANNRIVRAHLIGAARRAWADLTRLDGALRFGHDHYLKLWHLSGPRIEADFILFDEAQDANPVMRAIVDAQTHAQRVYVGDSQQQIYSFTGAVNALAGIDDVTRTFLTQSFRFGPAIADQANRVLTRLNAPLRITGTPTIPSTVGPVDTPDVVLYRTNAKAVARAFAELDAGRRPHIVGGATEVISFARGAGELIANGWTAHPELSCFSSWADVVDYVDNDQQGGELRLLVKLVDEFTVERIIDDLGRQAPEADADVVISTAHKAKGREWERVELGADFPDGTGRDGVTPEEPDDEELRLVYVAMTRARLALDLGRSVSKLLDADEVETAAPLDERELIAIDPAPAGFGELGATVTTDLDALFALPAAVEVKTIERLLDPAPLAADDVIEHHDEAFTRTALATLIDLGRSVSKLLDADEALAGVDLSAPTLAAAILSAPNLTAGGGGAIYAAWQAAQAAQAAPNVDDEPIEAELVDALPAGCPTCGRTDVVRSTGMIGAHRCAAVHK